MADAPSRRAMLRTAGSTAAVALGGCLLNNPEVSGGRLFVENFLPNDYRVQITVTEGTDRQGNQVVGGWYRVPQDHALQFQGVIEAGTTYTVTVHRPTVAPEDSVTVTVPPCEGNQDIGRDVSVRLRADGMGIIPWGCDVEEYARRELEYVDPSEYRIDPPEATATGTATDGS